MYKEIKSRRLALLVAIALTGGSLAGATNAYAAGVTGQNVKINASTPPSNNATAPGGYPGSAAGAINDPANGDDVSGNTLTLENYDYSVHGGVNPNTIYGGFTRGTGRAKENIVHICSGGIVDAAVGGINCGGGDAVGNRVYLHAGGLVNEAVSGGSVYGASGSAENNHVVIESGRVNDVIYGGCIGIASTGHATGNTVTITGGEIRGHVYGGFTYGNGDVTGNIVNIGDGAHDLATGTSIQKSIYGGSNDGGSGTISGNILNVKASASAQNIHNFDTINFYFTNTLSPKLTLSDTAGTTIKRLRDITVNGFATIGTSTLIENANGITVSEGSSSVSTTGDTAETILSRDTTGKKIDYTRYVFKGARTAESSSFHETWGGRSVIGNTTTGNEITVTSGTHTDVYGGWTRDDASSQTATADKGNSTHNKVTVSGSATVSGNVYGGMTTVEDGKASHNEVTINGGTLSSGNVYGGSADSGSSADNNKVYLNGIRTSGTVYGGATGTGTANGNEVHLNGATVTGAVIGGNGDSTSGNKVYLLNGAQVTGPVFGGNATSANDNEVHLNGATVTGPVYGGAANGTGNLLSVKGVNSAKWIAGFQKVSFDTAGVAAGQHMLTITDTANRTALDWNALTATGTARGIDLIYHEQGIALSHYTAGSVKSALSEDGKSEYDIEAVREGGTVKRIAYNSYQFKDARTAESSINHETWGGRSVIGNTTTGNEITVTSGTHTDVYGGWTRGASSQTATADKGNSTDNKVTVDGTATVNGNVYGGMTTVSGGKASHNEVTINGGTLNGSGDVYGGSVASGSSADDNKVYLNGISTPGTVYGGSAGLGTANGNEVHLNGATVTGAVIGGNGDSTSGNKVYLLNGAQVTGDVYGGNAASADENEVHLNGATVTSAVYGGAAAGTGNLLSVKGVNRAGWIAGFQKVTFDATGVAADETMLNLNGSAGTTLERDAINATGDTVSGGITLLHNANGITVNGLAADDNILKSEADATTEKNIAAHRTGGNITDIRYEGYQFAGVTAPVISGTDVYGGISRAGNSTHDNVITVNGDYANVYGGHTSGAGTTRDDKDNSYSNTVTITGGTLGNVYGGYTAAADGTTNHNTVTLAGGTVTGTVSGGNRTAQGNKLVVNANARVGKIENFEKYVFNYKESMAANPMLTLTGGAAAMNLSAIEANGTVTETPTTLVHNAAGLTIADYDNKPKSMLNADGTRETNLDVKKTGTLLTDIIRYSSYRLKGTTESTTNNGNTWGGRSAAGNTTAENSVTITGGNHTNIYGGWTTGTGSQAAADKRGDSISNNVTVSGSAAVSGTVYGGYTDVTGGRASNNTVNLGSVTVNQVVGGEGTTTDNNTVNINGTTVRGTITGGTQAMGTGNTLNVAGTNTAANIVGFQKVAFNMNGVAAHGTMLNLTGGAATKVDWTNLTATGTAVKPLTLLKNESGIDLVGYTGAAKSETTDTAETNVDVRKNNDGKVTEITYEGYQFARAESASVIGTDAYGGISRAGNATHTNHITVNSDYTNVYGGHTSGTSATAVEKKNSHDNTVTITGGTIGNVYGGYTDAADGTTNHNTVTLAGGTVTGTVSGGNRTAQGNKLVVNANARVGKIENFEKYVFNYKESMAANPMLTLTGGAAAMNLSAIEANGTVTETPTTLVHNAAGLTIADYDNKPKSMLNADGTRETNLDVKKTGTLLTDIIRYSSYRLKGSTESTTSGGNTWGGRSAAGNTTTENSVTITGGNHTDIYGGWTTGTGSTAAAERRGDSTSNKVTVNGSATVSGTVYGGYSDVTGGKATRNEVTVDKAIAGSVVGGQSAGDATGNIVNIKADSGAITGGRSASGEASGNSVTVGNGTVSGNIVGGDGTTTNKNIVSLAQANVTGSITGGSGTTANENTVNIDRTNVAGTITGGTQADGTGNTLNVKGQNAAQNIVGFQKVTFKDAASKLTLTDTGTFNLDTLATNFDATANPVTLVESANALTLAGGKAFKSELNADGTQETDLDVRSGKRIVRYAYTFAGAKAATTVGADTWGGRSAAGNTTTNNEITLTDGSYTNVYGGRTTGSGSQAAADKCGDSISNKVTVNGTAAVSGIVYGGYTDVTGGRAMGNEVTIEKATVDSVVGGYGTTASGNVINLTDATVSGSVTGGRGTITNDNIIRLRNTKVTGTVTGGSGTITNENSTGFRSVTVSSTAASGTGNTLAVYYGTGTTSIGDLGGIQNIHFDLEDAPTDGTAHTLLSLTNAAGEKNLSDIHLAVHRSGATKKLRKGDTFTLVENTTAGGSVSIGDNVTAEGTDGVTRNYTFGIARNADGKLVATVTKAGMNEQAKSLVETRAGASAFLNDGADFLAGAGMSAAQKEAAAAAMTSGGVYGLWAGMGGGSLRHETGSYVDMKGWNLGVGWARENAVKAGTLTFGPFIEYGRGSYDSYLDDGTHGSGKTSYVGVGMMAKLETKANSWIDGALRVGRTKSDYTGLDTGYDTTSTYYAMHVGVGKDFRVREGDTVSAYVRYSYAHTAGASAHLSSGETYDFDAVNSHRLRIGTRYTHGETALSQFYAGLAWEYEFGGDARATCDGDSTPSPSLRGGSGLLELGYRFAPKADSRVSYDLNLSGWQGKRQGVTGGVSVKWAF